MQLYPLTSRVEEPNTFLTSSLPINTSLKAWFVGDNNGYSINSSTSASAPFEITTWNDLSTNNNHISSSGVQSGFSSSCAYLSETPLNGHAGITFSGASSLVRGNVALTTTTTTVYMVAITYGTSGPLFMNGKAGNTVGTSNGWAYVPMNSGLNPALIAYGVSTTNFTTVNMAPGVPYVIAFTRNGSTHLPYVNGIVYSSVSVTPGAASGFFGLGSVNTDLLGFSAVGKSCFTMYELIAYDALHSASQVTQMSMYLGRKYKIPVSNFT